MFRIDGRRPNASGQMMTAGCAPVAGVNEGGIARAVRRFDLDVRFRYLLLRGEIGACRSDDACRHCRDEVSSCELIVFHGRGPPAGEE